MGSGLEFVTTDELVDELARRFQSIVLLTLKVVEGTKDEKDEQMKSWYRGGWNNCFGLVTRAKARWEQHERENSVHVRGDDEDDPQDENG